MPDDVFPAAPVDSGSAKTEAATPALTPEAPPVDGAGAAAEVSPPTDDAEPKAHGGARKGAGRPPGSGSGRKPRKKAPRRKVKAKAKAQGPQEMPDLLSAMGIDPASAPDDPTVQMLKAISDPMAAGALVVQVVDEGAKIGGAMFLESDQSIGANDEQKAMMGAAWGVYIATMEWQPSPAQMLAFCVLGCYGPNIARALKAAEDNAKKDEGEA